MTHFFFTWLLYLELMVFFVCLLSFFMSLSLACSQILPRLCRSPFTKFTYTRCSFSFIFLEASLCVFSDLDESPSRSCHAGAPSPLPFFCVQSLSPLSHAHYCPCCCNKLPQLSGFLVEITFKLSPESWVVEEWEKTIRGGENNVYEGTDVGKSSEGREWCEVRDMGGQRPRHRGLGDFRLYSEGKEKPWEGFKKEWGVIKSTF